MQISAAHILLQFDTQNGIDIDYLVRVNACLFDAGGRLFILFDADDREREICDTLSIGASVQNILLKATEMGYGTLWIANTCFAYNELADYIGIKGQLVGAISLGVSNENPEQRPRKSFSEVLRLPRRYS